MPAGLKELLSLRGAGWLGVAFLGLSLLAPATAHTQVVTRGPYLQLVTPTSAIVRWRTDLPTDSVVRYGTTVALGASEGSAAPTTEHAITLSALPSATKHFYAVGNAAGILAGGDASHFLVTAPASGSAAPTRIWVLGDSGKANQDARDVRDAYQGFTGGRGTDVFLMLGDNAYDSGTDAEYQAAVFDTYPEQLRQVALWPTLGNHDTDSASSATQTGPYFDMFSLPRNAEAGGVASGTEAYYSFDHANVHFVCLDSDDSDTSPGGPMLTWLEADLAATTQDWIIAYWHHTPYAGGAYHSDFEAHGSAMREIVLPLLEAHGVDLVLAGHDHTYQRSFLVDGHYGLASSFTSVMALDGGDGSESGDGAYWKPEGFAPNAGTVYTVAGSSAGSSRGPFDHPTTRIGLDRPGSLVIDVEGARLDARFVDDAGSVADHWTLVKSPDDVPPSLLGVEALGPYTVAATFTEPLDPIDAETPSHYAIAPFEAVSEAVLQAGSRTVWLTTSRLVPGTLYTLDVAGVSDRAGNPAAPGTQADFSFSAEGTLELRIANGDDDAEQSGPSDSVDLGSGDLELGVDAAWPQLVGLRFPDLRLPTGAIVEVAYLQFQVDEVSLGPAAFSIEAEAADDAAPFSTTDDDLGARPRSVASVPWTPPDWPETGVADAAARSPDLSALLQEVVARPGWVAGNAIALLVSGSGTRVAESHEGTSAGAPLLHVEYRLPVPQCSDGMDNDWDSSVDFPDDPQCLSEEHHSEYPPPPRGAVCGLGPELAVALVLLIGARARWRSRPRG